MEFDELKHSWQTLGRQLERQEAIQLELLRERKLVNARGSLRPLWRGQAVQLLLGIGLIALGIACWSRNTDIPALFAAGIAVHVFGVANLVLAGITLGGIAGIDYSAPVMAIQNQHARLLRRYLLNSYVCGFGWWLMWMPITLAVAGLGHLNLATQALPFLWSGLAVSAIGFAGTGLYFQRLKKRSALDVASVGDGADGIRRARRTLDEIARFERD